MKYRDFKNIIESLGYDDDTEIRLYISTYNGESYELKIEDIEDVDRKNGFCNSIDIDLSDPPKEYLECMEDSCIRGLISDLEEIIRKYD